jgi:hypothetical protein
MLCSLLILNFLLVLRPMGLPQSLVSSALFLSARITLSGPFYFSFYLSGRCFIYNLFLFFCLLHFV